MSFSDEVLGTKENQNTKTNNFSTRKNNNKNNWVEKQKQDRQEIYDSMNKMATIISTDGEKFKEYLDIQSHFPKHSVGNCCVILEKMPYATQIKDKISWEEKGIAIKENAKGIKILEPVNKDGKIYYNPKEVFDISQTNTDTSVDFVYDTRKLLDAITTDCSAKLVAVDELSNGEMGVEYNKEKNTLYVCKKLTKKTLFQELFQEIAKIAIPEEKGKNFKSYCISYMLCKRYGIDTADFKFNGISQEIRGDKPKDIRRELEISRETFEQMNTKISEFFEQGVKEKNKVTPER